MTQKISWMKILFFGIVMIGLTVVHDIHGSTPTQAKSFPAPVVRYTFDAPFGYQEPNAALANYEALIPRNSVQQAAPRRETGLFGNAIRKAQRQNIKATFPTDSEFTIHFWALPETLDAPHLFNINGLRVDISRDSPKATLLFNKATLASTAILTNAWNSFAITSTGEELSFYINGQLIKKTPAVLTNLKDQPYTIGGITGPHHSFNGLIDEFRIYDQVLSSNQIATLSDEETALMTAPATADAGIDHTVYMKNKSCSVPLNGQYTGIEATDTLWSITEQPKSSHAKIDQPKALKTNATFSEPGNYKLELTVKSANGLSVDSINVVVFPTPEKRQGKLFKNPNKPGTLMASYKSDEDKAKLYKPDFVKKWFPNTKPELVTKGFAKERFRKPPPAYVHPRIFFNPEDLPAMRKRIKYGKAASSAYAKVNRMYNMIAGNGIPADYIKSNGSYNGSTGAAYCIGAYMALIEGDSQLARKLIEGAVRQSNIQMEIMEKWSKEELQNWQNKGHSIPARYATAYVYDFLYPWMTEIERAKIRKVIAKMTQGVHSIGMYSVPNAVNASNWVCWVTGDLLANILAIEGEDGYDPVVAQEAMNAMAKFSRWGIQPDGSSFEGMGKNSITGQNLVAMAKRGNYAIAYPNIYNHFANFHLYVMQPFGNLFIADDLWGSSRYKARAVDATCLKYAYPDDPIINFVYRNAVDGAQYRSALFTTTYRYTNPLTICMFGEDWDGPEDWNEHAAQAMKEKQRDCLLNYSNIATARSAWEQDATFLYFLPRMYGGHPSPARGTFVFSALGRDWSIYPTGHNDKSSLQHSIITVDGKSTSTKWGKMVAYDSNKNRMIAIADLRNTYGGTSLPNASHNDFRLIPDPAPWYNMPGWQMPHWYNGDRPGRSEEPTFNKYQDDVQSAFRSVALVREERPYALIVDNMQIDNQEHNYRWQMVLPADLHKNVTTNGSDAIITDPETGNFVLVRVIDSNVPLMAKFESTKEAGSVIVYEADSKILNITVMLMAFEKGETPPKPDTIIPGLKKTLKEMTKALKPTKQEIVKAEKEKRKMIMEELEGFTPESLGEPIAFSYPDNHSVEKVDGIVGQAFHFKGDQYITLPGVLPPYGPEKPFTLSFWAKEDGNPEGCLYDKGSHHGLSATIFQGKYYKISADKNWYWCKTGHQLGNWCHIVFSYDGNELSFYQNGELIHKAPAKMMNKGSETAVFGKSFKGKLDGLQAYPKALSQENIEKLHLYQRCGIKNR